MDLIYTNPAREDLGVLQDYDLDLAFGADENNFECTVPAASHCCEAGSLLYMEGTEYGGIVDSIKSNTESQEVTYIGRTWHGILDSKVIEPDSGEDYLVCSGEANSVIANLLSRLAIADLFEASNADSGLKISNYKMNRYITGYDGIMKMLNSVAGKLKVSFDKDRVVLSAVALHDYTKDEEFDADQIPFNVQRNYKGVNHLICLGSGQLSERLVVHLYADAEGNISRTQTLTGLDEVASIYEYSTVSTEEELVKEGTEKFKSLLASDDISIDIDTDSDIFDVGDFVGAYDHITGLSASTKIAKKIVTIKNGKITISLSPDTAKSGSSMEKGGSSGGTNSGETSNESDPTVPAWAKQPTKPTYTHKEVGADPSGSASAALKSAQEYTDKQIAAIPTPDVSGQISTHNTATDAHNDIRLLVSGLTERLNALANSDDTTLDQMAEVVAYIKANRDLIEQVTTGKVSVADIVDNLTTNVSNRPLSAAQGVFLKSLIDAIVVPTKVSALENDSGYAKKTELPTKTSQLDNDSGFLTKDTVGKMYKGAWIASECTGISQHYTETITLPPGTYIITVNAPYCSDMTGRVCIGFSAKLALGSGNTFIDSAYGFFTTIATFTTTTNLCCNSAASANSATWSYLDRGGIAAIRIA